MNEVILIILKILPIILILLLGVWMKKIGFINAEIVGGMKKITLGISLPCILFLTFFRAEIEPKFLILSAVVFIVCILLFGTGFLIKKLKKSPNPFYPSLFTTFLTGPIGFPLFSAYFGAENLYKLALLDVGNSIFIFTVLIAFLSTVSCNKDKTEKKSIAALLKNMMKSPLTISMFLGIMVSMTGKSSEIEKLPAASAVLETLSLMANSAFPMTLLIIGFELPFQFKDFKKTMAAVLLRMAIMLPIAYLINTFVIVRWMGLDETYQAALYTMFILPPPFIIPLSIIGECEHKEYVLNFISLHLVVSLAIFVMIMAII